VTTDITEHKREEDRIRYLAQHDSLTGLPNRMLFYDRLAQAVRLAKRDSRQFALLYLDLDAFKPVNDNLGHDAGDELLMIVAKRVHDLMRDSDTVSRIGGDEFTVILPDVKSRVDVGTIAQKLVVALAAPYCLKSCNEGVEIGTSIGIAVYPTDAEDADALIKAADTAMYEAKKVRHCFRFFGA
jgi:diguanylate cyclase (GGDEF)-like protein